MQQPGETAERVVHLAELGQRLAALRLCEAEALARMQRSLETVGQVSPISVFTAAAGGLEVLDGFKRVRAANALGRTELRAQVLAVDAVEAKVAITVLHERGGLTGLEEAWLVRSLYREDGLTQPEIGRRLSRDKSWVSRRLLLAEALDDAVQADVRLGLVSASAAEDVARLPRRNQQQVAQVVARTGLTCRQTARLVDEVLACGDDVGRSEVIARWRSAPPARAPPHPARRVRSETEWLLGDVATVTRVAARLEARLLAQPLAAHGERAGELCAHALSALLPVLTALGRTIAHVTGEPTHALDHSRGARAPGGHAPPAGPHPPGHRPGALGEPQHGP